MSLASRDEYLRQLIVDRVFDVAFVIQPDGVVSWRRESTRQPLGVADEEIEGQLILGRLHPEDLPDALRGLERLARHPGERSALSARIRSARDPQQWQRIEVIGVGLTDDPLVGGVLVCSRVRDVGELDLAEGTRDGFSLAAAAPLGLGLVSAADRLVWVNDTFAVLTGLEANALEAPPIDAGLVVAEIARLLGMLRAGHDATSTIALGERFVRLRARLLSTADPARTPTEPLDVLVSAEDMTSELRAISHQAVAEATFRAAFDQSQAGMAVVEIDGRFRRLNPAWSTITGYDEPHLVGRTFAEITHPDDIEADTAYVQELLEGARASYRMEKRYLHRTGGTIWVDLRVALVRDAADVPLHFVATIIDISERRGVEDTLRADNESLSYQATHDHLTGLPNRHLLDEHLRVAALRLPRTTGATCVLLADLDRFKAVNDEHGHAAGDAVLVEVANRLRGVCREGDIVARWGGDEFVVVADAFEFPSMAVQLAERLIAAVRRPIDVAGTTVAIGVSIGIAKLRNGEGPDQVVSRADKAVYDVKQAGGGYSFAGEDEMDSTG